MRKTDAANADRKHDDPENRGPSTRWVSTGERAAAGLRDTAAAVVARRGMPLAVAGGGLVLVAWLAERDSAWALPMMIAGLAMIGLGLLGPRLSGSLALRWGDDGAFLQVSTAIAPPGRRLPTPDLDPQPTIGAAEPPPALIPPGEIEGEAETIDYSVEALKTALAAEAE